MTQVDLLMDDDTIKRIREQLLSMLLHKEMNEHEVIITLGTRQGDIVTIKRYNEESAI